MNNLKISRKTRKKGGLPSDGAHLLHSARGHLNLKIPSLWVISSIFRYSEFEEVSLALTEAVRWTRGSAFDYYQQATRAPPPLPDAPIGLQSRSTWWSVPVLLSAGMMAISWRKSWSTSDFFIGSPPAMGRLWLLRRNMSPILTGRVNVNVKT